MSASCEHLTRSLKHVIELALRYSPQGIVLPQSERLKLAGNDLSDMRRGNREKREKQQQDHSYDVDPALTH